MLYNEHRIDSIQVTEDVFLTITRISIYKELFDEQTELSDSKKQRNLEDCKISSNKHISVLPRKSKLDITRILITQVAAFGCILHMA